MKEPQRTCVTCRRTGDKRSFIRFVLSPDNVVTPDIDSRLPGRGAYTCVSRRCLLDSIKKGLFNRAFKVSASPGNPEELDSILQKRLLARIAGYVSLAAKAGAVVSGGEAVERTLRGLTRPSLMVLALDASAQISGRLESMALRHAVPCARVLYKEELGVLLGKDSDRSSLLVMSAGFASSLLREIERYWNYLQEESGR